jgi:hypothetical protein
MNRQEFYTKIIKLAELYSKELNQTQVEAYYNFIGRYPEDRINAAMIKIIESEQFFPAIATFKRYLGGNGSAIDILRRVEDTLRSGHGRNNFKEARECMGEQAYKAIEMLGGWSAYCNMEPMKASQELIKCCAKVAMDDPSERKEIES